MDRNTTTGLLLIGAILIGFSYFLRPSEAELEQLKRQEDSLKAARQVDTVRVASPQGPTASPDEPAVKEIAPAPAAQVQQANLQKGPFQVIPDSLTQDTWLENDKVRILIRARGAQPSIVELPEFKTWDQKPLYLLNGSNSSFGVELPAGNMRVRTQDLNFTRSQFQEGSQDKPSVVRYRLMVDEGAWLEFEYSLAPGAYKAGLKIRTQGMLAHIPASADYLQANWALSTLQTEKDIKNERMNARVYYKFKGDEVDYISERKDDEESLNTPVRWMSFKQHFFTSILEAESSFDEARVVAKAPEDDNYIRHGVVEGVLPLRGGADQEWALNFYFSPLHYQTLKAHGLEMERQIRLGWGILGWINRLAVIPVFNFFEGLGWNYGIIILVLTVLLKILLFPLTYKSYLSMAKMKVLKPEMDEIKEKHKDQMKQQQEMMALYKKAGVNPLGGCLPMLFQLPILIAFFYFFPSSIELRQESFLWAHDLSTYDSIWTFGKVPIIDLIYGDHVSLFTLLMTISTLLYTYLNNQISGISGQMKYMGYIMPIFFLGFFNNYSAGLTYYYFCANMITFGQQWMIRSFVDEDAIHRKIQANKKKPVKKSRFQAKLEEMARQNQQRAKKKK